ncbi:MAG TPA: hypothetical protein VHO28_13550 [Ignavibacteriales bacterium]|nr:hypothetical protein [Ignavibacteriales bacterium]
MKHAYKIFFLLVFLSTAVFGQGGGLNFTLGFPQGEFKDNVDRLGFGGSIHGVLWEPNSRMPFTVGLNFGFLNYGSESRNTPLSNPIPDVTVDVDRTNNLVNFHLLFQVSPFDGPVRPYVETLFGGAYIFTETSVNSEISNEEVVSSTNFDDWAWNYGGGAGMMIKLYSGKKMGEISSLWLDLKCRYIFGTEAEYLKEGSVDIDRTNGTVYYYPSKSKTDLLTLNLGVVIFM